MSVSETLEVLVKQRHEETAHIVRLELVLESGERLPAFEAGAHVDVWIPNSDLVRQYSLVNVPSDNQRYVLAVQREENSRGGSSAIHDLVKEGSKLTISYPKNHFELQNHAAKAVLIAGGIGITPIISMAQQLHQEQRDFALHYVCRTPQRMAFSAFLDSSAFNDKVQRYYSEPQPEAFNIRAILATLQADEQVYVCGPASLIEAVRNEAQALGIESSRLHREYFHADTSLSGKENQAFEITLASTGQTFIVPENETIAQVLDANDVFVPVSCEEGVCGTCLTAVLEGEVDHRDVYLTDEEKQANNQITVCCSRAKNGRLLLDL